MTSSSKDESNRNLGFTLGNTALIMLLSILGISLLRTYTSGDPLLYIIPNMLMFTPFRQLNIQMWEKFGKAIDKSIEHDMTRIPHIKAEDYTYESLKKASENFKYPVLIKLAGKILKFLPVNKDKKLYSRIRKVNDLIDCDSMAERILKFINVHLMDQA